MFVAILQVELRLPDPRTLKERRRIVNSIKDRLRYRFQVSVAEVGPVENYHEATLGISLVSNDPRQARTVSQRIVQFLDRLRDASVTDVQTEII